MREGGGGRRALSLFRFHLSSFPPETPDTEDKNTGTCLSYNAINLPGTGNIFSVCAKWETDRDWCF